MANSGMHPDEERQIRAVINDYVNCDLPLEQKLDAIFLAARNIQSAFFDTGRGRLPLRQSTSDHLANPILKK